MTLMPAGSYTPQMVWSSLVTPDIRVWNVTKTWGVPANLTFLNATSYAVRENPNPLCSVTEALRVTHPIVIVQFCELRFNFRFHSLPACLL